MKKKKPSYQSLERKVRRLLAFRRRAVAWNEALLRLSQEQSAERQRLTDLVWAYIQPAKDAAMAEIMELEDAARLRRALEIRLCTE